MLHLTWSMTVKLLLHILKEQVQRKKYLYELLTALNGALETSMNEFNSNLYKRYVSGLASMADNTVYENRINKKKGTHSKKGKQAESSAESDVRGPRSEEPSVLDQKLNPDAKLQIDTKKSKELERKQQEQTYNNSKFLVVYPMSCCIFAKAEAFWALSPGACFASGHLPPFSYILWLLPYPCSLFLFSLLQLCH